AGYGSAQSRRLRLGSKPPATARLKAAGYGSAHSRRLRLGSENQKSKPSRRPRPCEAGG
ncbi:hypothetical protein AURDEDRAFT_178592, partial [Auricularia subglabra TFB-10046 SS5]